MHRISTHAKRTAEAPRRIVAISDLASAGHVKLGCVTKRDGCQAWNGSINTGPGLATRVLERLGSFGSLWILAPCAVEYALHSVKGELAADSARKGNKEVAEGRLTARKFAPIEWRLPLRQRESARRDQISYPTTCTSERSMSFQVG